MWPPDDFRDGGGSQTWRFLVSRTQIVHTARTSPTFLHAEIGRPAARPQPARTLLNQD